MRSYDLFDTLIGLTRKFRPASQARGFPCAALPNSTP